MRRSSLWAATAFGTLSYPWLAWAGAAGEGGYGHGHMMGGAHWIIGPIMMVLFVAAIVVVVVLVVRWLGGGRAGGRAGGLGGARPKAAQDILEERFARGEIDKEEFEQRRQALRD